MEQITVERIKYLPHAGEYIAAVGTDYITIDSGLIELNDETIITLAEGQQMVFAGEWYEDNKVFIADRYHLVH